MGGVGYVGSPVGASKYKRQVFSLALLLRGPAAAAACEGLSEMHILRHHLDLTHHTRGVRVGHHLWGNKLHRSSSLGEWESPPCTGSNLSGLEMGIYVRVSEMAALCSNPWQDHEWLVAKSLITHPKEMNYLALGIQGCSIKGKPG